MSKFWTVIGFDDTTKEVFADEIDAKTPDEAFAASAGFRRGQPAILVAAVPDVADHDVFTPDEDGGRTCFADDCPSSNGGDE